MANIGFRTEVQAELFRALKVGSDFLLPPQPKKKKRKPNDAAAPPVEPAAPSPAVPVGGELEPVPPPPAAVAVDDVDQAGDDQAGDDQAGDDQAGDDQAGDDQAGDDQAGDDQAGDDQAGDDQAGDDQAGDDQAGDDDGDGETGEPDKTVEDAARQELNRLREESNARLQKIGKVALGTYAVITAIFIGYQLHRGGLKAIQTKAWWSDSLGATVVTAAIIFGVVALLSLLMQGSTGGLRRLIIGKDGRFSTSLTQSAMWTLAIGYALLYLLLRSTVCRGGTTCVDSGSAFTELNATYLFLLGGPFAAAAAAKVAVTTKVSAGTLQRVPATDASVTDVLCNDDGETDLVDTQFFLFNVLALVYFTAAFIQKADALPNLPDGLVALTSLSALTYATNKAIAANAPVLTAVKKSNGAGPLRPGDVVDVMGTNLVPAGAGSLEYLTLLSVRFGDVMATLGPVDVDQDQGGLSGTRLRATVPDGLVEDVYNVTVVTAAGVTSNPVQVKVEDDIPVLNAVTPATILPGGMAHVVGTFLTSNLVEGRPYVDFGGNRVPVKPAKGQRRTGYTERYSVRVPGSLQPGAVEVNIVTAAGESTTEGITVNVGSAAKPRAAQAHGGLAHHHR